MLLYFAGAIFGGYIVMQDSTLLPELLAYIGAPTAVAIGFYAWKAKAENIIKISATVKDREVLAAAVKQDESEGYYGTERHYNADNWSTDTDYCDNVSCDTAERESPRMAEIRRIRSGTPLG
jgi:hypothetical protein